MIGPARCAQHGWLLALLAYMLVSTIWSDITLIAFRRWAREAIVVIMALVIMSEANAAQALESVLRRSAYILVPFSLMLDQVLSGFGRRLRSLVGPPDVDRRHGPQEHSGSPVRRSALCSCYGRCIAAGRTRHLGRAARHELGPTSPCS